MEIKLTFKFKNGSDHVFFINVHEENEPHNSIKTLWEGLNAEKFVAIKLNEEQTYIINANELQSVGISKVTSEPEQPPF